jgi:hypothetical protein
MIKVEPTKPALKTAAEKKAHTEEVGKKAKVEFIGTDSRHCDTRKKQ